MAMSLVVIGIPAWPWKSKMLVFANKNPNIIEMEAAGTCHECSRHLELLDFFDKGRKDFKSSEYFLYQKSNGKKSKLILRKISKFRKLYGEIKLKEHVGYPVITDDGCRLDGSHRCAVAVHCSEPVILVNLVSYESRFGLKQSKKIRSQVSEYRKKVYQL